MNINELQESIKAFIWGKQGLDELFMFSTSEIAKR